MKKYYALSAMMVLWTGVMWGQVNITPIRTDVSGFGSWVDVDVAGTTYIQILKATSSTTSPDMNFDNYTNETLDFKARTFGGVNATENTITVWISTDNGSNWTNLGTRTPTNTTLTAMTQFDLSSYNGTQVKIKFTVAGTSDGVGAGIDDISIMGIVSSSNSSSSNIVEKSGYTYLQNISYSSYQATDISNSSNDLELAKFTIQDGGGSADADAEGTTLTSITFSVTNSSNIRRIALYDGDTEIGTEQAGSSSVTFSSLSLTAADDDSKDFSVRVSFNSTVTDNHSIQFTVTSATADVAGSTFTDSDAGGAASDITGDNNKLEVTADRLAFSSNKPFATVSMGSNFAVEVKSVDANANVDLDQTTSVTLSLASGSGGLSSTTGLTQNLTAGVYTWNDVQYDSPGSFSILASDGVGTGLTDATSISVTAQENRLTENFDYDASTLLTNNGWTAHSGAGTEAITVNDGGLTITNYPSVSGNAALLDQNGEDVNRTFSEISAGSVYISFLVKVTTIADGYFLNLGPSSIGTTYRGRVFIRNSSGNLQFGLSNGSNTGTFSSNNYATGTTYLLVLKYSVVSGTTNDEVSLFVFEDLEDFSSEPGTPTIGPLTDGAISDINPGSIALRQYLSTQNIIVDGIRISESWSQAPLPVELTSFTAVAKGRGVELAWSTATEVNNYGFEVEKRMKDELGIMNWEKIGFVEGYGTTNAPKSYTFVDGSASGTVAYRLKQIDRDGSYEYSNQVEVTVAAPKEFSLMQNHPNPFNPATSISYTLPAAGHVTLKVYDLIGKEVATLVNGMQDAGVKIANFDASQLPSGMYFYTLKMNNFTATKKMMLVK